MSFSNLFHTSNNSRFESFKAYIYNLYNNKNIKLTNEEYKTIFSNIVLYREKCFYQNLEKLVIIYHCDYVWLNYSDSEDNYESVYLPLIQSYLKDENMQIEQFNNIVIEQRHNFEIIETIIKNNILNFNSDICIKIIKIIFTFINKQREIIISKRSEDSFNRINNSTLNSNSSSISSNNINNNQHYIYSSGNNNNNQNNNNINLNYYFIYLLKSIIIFKNKIGLNGYQEFRNELYQFFNDLFIMIPTSKVRKDMILLFEFANFIKELDFNRKVYYNLLLKSSILNDYIHHDVLFQKKNYNQLLVAIQMDNEIFENGFNLIQDYNYIIEPLLKKSKLKIRKFNQFLFELKVNKQYFPNSLESILATLEFSISIPIIKQIIDNNNWGGNNSISNDNYNGTSSSGSGNSNLLLFNQILLNLLKKCDSVILRSLFTINEDLIQDKDFLKQLYQDTLDRLLKSRTKLFESSVEQIFSNINSSPTKMKFIQENLQFFFKKLYIGQIYQFIYPIFKQDCENSIVFKNKSIILLDNSNNISESPTSTIQANNGSNNYYKNILDSLYEDLSDLINQENNINQKKDDNDNEIMKLLNQLNNIPIEKNLIRDQVSIELDQYLFPNNNGDRLNFNKKIKKEIEEINKKERSLIDKQILFEKESTLLTQQLNNLSNKKFEKRNQMIKIIDQLVSKRNSSQNKNKPCNIISSNKCDSSSRSNKNLIIPIYIKRLIISLLFEDSSTSQFTKLSISLVSKQFLELSIDEMNNSLNIPISINYRYDFNSSLSLLKSNVKNLKYSFTYKKKYRHYFYHDYDERLNEELELINSKFKLLQILDLRKCEINNINLNIFNQPNKFINLKLLILSSPKKIINEKKKELNEIEAKRITIQYI